MNRDKQIKEMAKSLCEHYGTDGCDSDNCECARYCNVYGDCGTLVDKGYRKASEVALEVIDEVKKLIKEKYYDNKNSLYDSPLLSAMKYSVRYNSVKLLQDLDNLKKKYTEGEE